MIILESVCLLFSGEIMRKSTALLDTKDYEILRIINKVLTVSYRSLSKQLSIPESTIRYRILKLRRIGVLKGFVALIDEEKLGYHTTALVNIRIKGPYRKDIVNNLVKERNIYYLYTISGNYDLVALVKCENIEKLRSIIERILNIPGVERTMTNVVFQKHKEVRTLIM